MARRRATFVQDAHQRLVTLSESLLTLERDSTDQATYQAALDEARRALHTLKGNAGLVGLETFAAAAHALEGALDEASSNEAAPALLLRGLDALSAMVAVLAEVADLPPPSVPVLEALKASSDDARLALPWNFSADVQPQTLRSMQVTVPIHHLDDLMELVEELRIDHGRLAQADVGPSGGAERALARQRRLLRELYNAVLRTRLLPVGQAFEGLDRLARDLAESLGRQAQVMIEGADTEVDRAVLEPVRELVVHLLRNALAHGLEPPEERRAAGKPPVGMVRVSARPVENGALIEVVDDGRGLDRQAVAARAVALGLCTVEQAAEMTDAQLWVFLAQPGFSTRDSVDRVSGRGMGLNAVRRGVEALRGRLEIGSQPGLGVTVSLWLPSMMALEEVVLVRVGSETYAIPQAVIDHTCRAGAEDVPALDLRERLNVPLDVSPSDGVLIVCRLVDRQAGLLVGGIAGRDEAVIKPLPRCAQRSYLLGAIVTAAGRVVLVLNVEQL